MRKILIVAGALTLLSGSAWNREPLPVRQSALGHELEVMGLTANAAKLIREGKRDQALRLLEHRLTSAADTSNAIVAAGTTLPADGSWPSLKDSAKRAASYARQNGMQDVATKADAVARSLR